MKKKNRRQIAVFARPCKEFFFFFSGQASSSGPLVLGWVKTFWSGPTINFGKFF